MQASASSKALTLNRRRQQELKRDEDEVCVCLASAGMFRPLKQFACLSEDNLRDLDSTLELLATPCGGVAEMLCGCQLGDSLCSRVFEICASSCTAHVCVL